jgi:serine phosphatase RsbU (regulator of sigma subunit)
LKEKTIRLKANDKFVLYTDCVIEAAVTSDDKEVTEVFGEEKFNSLLNKIRNKNAGVIKKEVCKVLEDFYQSQSPIDDYTLLIIQRSGGSK